MARRFVLPVLTVLLVLAAVVPASAARRAHNRRITRVTVSAEGRGSVIAVTYGGPRQRVRFLHSAEAIDRVALNDVNADGDVDILAAPRARDGAVVLWRNEGNGRFELATLRQQVRLQPSSGSRFVRVRRSDEGSQWGDERYDAAMPRAPSIATVEPIALVRILPLTLAPPTPVRRLSGRAPPSLR
jgi:hypothetical protein